MEEKNNRLTRAVGKGLALTSFDELQRFAKAATMSGLVGYSRRDPPAVALAKSMMVCQYGAELGVPPMAALQGIHVIEGKPALGAGLISALIQKSGIVKYRVTSSNAEECVLSWFEFVDGAWERVGTSTFTIAEAKSANLAGRDNWKKYTSDMLFARALTRGARRFAPAIFAGSVYTPDEISSGGEYIEAEVLQEQIAEPTQEQLASAHVDRLLERDAILDAADTDAEDMHQN